MPKGKGPGAPYGNKNASGPHKGYKRTFVNLLVKGSKLVKHPNNRAINVANSFKMGWRYPEITPKRNAAGEKAAKDFGSYLGKLYNKRIAPFKRAKPPRPIRQKRYRNRIKRSRIGN